MVLNLHSEVLAIKMGLQMYYQSEIGIKSLTLGISDQYWAILK